MVVGVRVGSSEMIRRLARLLLTGPVPALTLSAFFALWSPATECGQNWSMAKVAETPPLSINGLYLNTTADLNGNGRKEIVVADFGEYGELPWDLRPEYDLYNLFVLEWKSEGSSIGVVWTKQWNAKGLPGDKVSDYFSAFKADFFVSLPSGKGDVVETIPPYFFVEYRDDKYVLHEQQNPRYKTDAIGSWVFPWQSNNCHRKLDWRVYPRECLIAIRNFRGDGTLRILTFWAEATEYFQKTGGKPIPTKFNVLLRIRKWAPGFPIEWEQRHPTEVHGAVFAHEQDRLNWRLSEGLVIGDQLTIAEGKRRAGKIPMHFFDLAPSGKGYRLRPVGAEWPFPDDAGRGFYPDIHIGHTRDPKISESWGYVRERAADVKFYNLVLRRAVLRPDLSAWDTEEPPFPRHEPFLGVGHYQVSDLDGDGRDEVIYVEQTGKRYWEGNADPRLVYADVKDYIRILRWNGKTYDCVWTSPPYTDHGTKILIDDVKGDGKKQLIVFNMSGTVEIWERK